MVKQIENSVHIKSRDNALSTISNTLIQARYDLSLVEKRLLYLFISGINNDIGAYQ